MTTICLNMIVKDESRVIRRCLYGLRHLISYYVIVDTGSTDDTKALIQKTLEGIPGEIIDRPWVDFGHNRTEAIQFAKGKADYLLIVDADDEIRCAETPQGLTEDAYDILVIHDRLQHKRIHLIRSTKPFRYEGVVHEYLTCDEPFTANYYPEMRYVMHPGTGSRSGDRSPEALKAKFLRDAAKLEEVVEKDPNNTRHVFYLAQSYSAAGMHESAIKMYERHIAMPEVWDQERWYSRLQIACIKRDQKFEEPIVIDAFLKAFEDRPTRIEPLYELGLYLQEAGRHELVCYLLTSVLHAELPTDRLLVDVQAYTWALKDVISVSSYMLGKYDLTKKIDEELLRSGYLPPNEVERVTARLTAAKAKLGETP